MSPAVLLMAACLGAWGGCGRPDQIELPRLNLGGAGSSGRSNRGSHGVFAIPEGKTACSRASDCDDRVACTIDICLEEGYCANVPDWTPCDDGVFCNGLEICDPVEGCRSPPTGACDDGNPCTVDQCDERSATCRHLARDNDGDGEADWHCPGGTDCDDDDPLRGSLKEEICGDGEDNDCDGVTDETECGRSPHDLCRDALEVDQDGTYQLSLSGAAPDYSLSCGVSSDPDVALKLELGEARDVIVRAEGIYPDDTSVPTAVAIWKNCKDAGSEIKCGSGAPGEPRVRALDPGDYYVLVSTSASQIAVEIRTSEPTAAPRNRTCASPLDISSGGQYHGDFVGVGDDYMTACGEPGAEDLTYVFTTQSAQDVSISVVTQTGERMSFEVRSECEDAASAIRCITGIPAAGVFHQLPAGTYYVVLEGPAYREIDFDLYISITDPTPVPLGDSCDNPASLPLGKARHGSLADKQDMASLACGSYCRDMVYLFEVKEPTDVSLRVDGGDSDMILGLELQCGEEDPSYPCVQCGPVVKRLRNLQPGKYYAIVESSVDTDFVIMAEPLPVTVPVAAAGNDTCTKAKTIEATGGIFSGTTAGMHNNYHASCQGVSAWSPDAAFKLKLNEAKRVTAVLEANFDSLLFRFVEGADGAAACDREEPDSCDDNGLYCDSSLLDEVLDPGTHYFVVDGYGSVSSGGYVLDVQVAEP